MIGIGGRKSHEAQPLALIPCGRGCRRIGNRYIDGARCSKSNAVHLGKALQLTNILRDVRTDADRGRIYLPLDELKKSGVSPEEILRHEYSERFAQLAAGIAGRAKYFYRLARETLPAEDRRSMVAAELMGSVYWRLLQKLEAKKFNVFGPQPTRLSNGYKTFLILQSWLQIAVGATASNYGRP